MAGVTQRTVYRLRRRVDEKLGRLPLAYFDRESRGDILSRVTNDIDNIAQTLQQSLTQLITALFTVIGVLAMMFWISPLLAVISLLIVPASDRRHGAHRAPLPEAVRRPVGADRHAQRPHRGDAHRPRHRQGVRAPARGDRDLRPRERGALRRLLEGAVHLRDDPARDERPREPQLRRHRRHRRRPGHDRGDVPRRRPGLHPVLAPVHDADRPDRQHHERAAVRGRLRGARLRAPRRAGAGAGHGDAAGARARRRPRGVRQGQLPLPARHAAPRRPRPRGRAGPHDRHRRPDRAPARRPS